MGECRTAASIIADLGGHAAVAARIGRDRSRVWRWCREGIPAFAAREVVRIAAEDGKALTFDAVMTAPGDKAWSARAKPSPAGAVA